MVNLMDWLIQWAQRDVDIVNWNLLMELKVNWINFRISIINFVQFENLINFDKELIMNFEYFDMVIIKIAVGFGNLEFIINLGLGSQNWTSIINFAQGLTFLGRYPNFSIVMGFGNWEPITNFEYFNMAIIKMAMSWIN